MEKKSKSKCKHRIRDPGEVPILGNWGGGGEIRSRGPPPKKKKSLRPGPAPRPAPPLPSRPATHRTRFPHNGGGTERSEPAGQQVRAAGRGGPGCGARGAEDRFRGALSLPDGGRERTDGRATWTPAPAQSPAGGSDHRPARLPPGAQPISARPGRPPPEARPGSAAPSGLRGPIATGGLFGDSRLGGVGESQGSLV